MKRLERTEYSVDYAITSWVQKTNLINSSWKRLMERLMTWQYV